MLLTVFGAFSPSLSLTIILLFVFTIVLDSILYLIINKVDYYGLGVNIAIFFLSLFLNEKFKGLSILILIFMILNLIFVILNLLWNIYKDLKLKTKTLEYTRNTDYDFFIQFDYRDKISDCSNSILKQTKLAKKEVLKSIGWKFIFDHFEVVSLNKEDLTKQFVSSFIDEFKRSNSRHKHYKFTIDIKVQTDSNKYEVISYIGIIQPVFFKNFLVARNVYFYQDRLQAVEKLKEIVRSACTDLEDAYLQLDMMMSMSEGVVMYYDYQNKVYVATDCMRQFTKVDQREYSFDQIYNRIHPDDIPAYLEQASTVNSLSVTKIRYRLLIGEHYYNVEEDTIGLRKDFGLISIIRIAEKEVAQNAPKNAKLRRDIDDLNSLVNQKIKEKLDKTIDLFNCVLTDSEKQDEN